ncbi:MULTISPECIES: hypothetical protein [unclassified Streptomyces]|uniref:hypothetical protein n=1 Tax=unclassified Streptomyces TaxID=2593676 RepID=UPI002E33FAD4|nr:hypothetical protein [Streptomyces sp. NBC_01361]
MERAAETVASAYARTLDLYWFERFVDGVEIGRIRIKVNTLRSSRPGRAVAAAPDHPGAGRNEPAITG